MPTGTRAAPGPLTQEVAAILRGHAARKRVSSSVLAEAVGLSESQVRRMLAGTKHIDVDVLDALCRSLDLEILDVVREAAKESGAGRPPGRRPSTNGRNTSGGRRA